MKTFQILSTALIITIFFSCRERVDGGSCTYEEISKTVKAINVQKDSTEIVSVEFQVLNEDNKIILGSEDFEMMDIEVEMTAFENDTLTFKLGGEENTVGSCQPFIWKSIK
jgi:hypothetical protein